MKSSTLVKVGIAIAVVAAGTGYFFTHRSPQAAAAATPTGEVKRADLTQRVTISGQIWPKKRLDIKPPFPGYVTKIYVKVGDHLKVNDPIVTFSQSLSTGEHSFPVRAGFEGVVTQLWKAGGEYVIDTGDQNLVVRVEDFSELSVLASVPEVDVAKLKLGQAALIRVTSLPGESFDGKLAEIDMSAKDKEKYGSSSTEFQVKASLGKQDPRLLPGMSTMMDVVTDKREKALTLAHEYIQEDQEGYFVTLASGDVRRIKIGLQTDESVEILDGLKEHDQVKAVDFLNMAADKK